MALSTTAPQPNPTTSALDGRGRAQGDSHDHGLTAALAAAQDGDQHALTSLYQDLQPRLLQQLRALVGENDAHDIASEAWMHIIAGIGRFRGSYRHFQFWAATIAKRRAADHLRRTPPPIPVDPTGLPDSPARNDTERDAIDALSTASTLNLIRTLPAEQRNVVLLRVVVGLDAPTTARILGKRPGSVRTGTHRGLQTLANRLQGKTPDELRRPRSS